MIAVALTCMAVIAAALGLAAYAIRVAFVRGDRAAAAGVRAAISDAARDEAVAALDLAIESAEATEARIVALEGIAHASGVLVPGAGHGGMLSALRRARDRAAREAAARDPGAAVVPDAAPASAPE